MAATKHLRELLLEDQEAFFLDDNIYDRSHHRKSIYFGERVLSSCFSSSVQYDVPKFGTAAMNDAILEVAQRIGGCGSKGRDLADGEKQGNSAAGTRTVELLLRTLKKLGIRSGKREPGHGEGGGTVQVRDILRQTISDPGHVPKQGKSNVNEIQKSHSESSDAPSVSERGEGKESLNDVGNSSFRCPAPESRSDAGCSKGIILVVDKDEAVEVGGDEKEQSSPVSVLDPPSFDDDTEEHDYDVNGYGLEDVDGFDHETSPSRTKQMLLRNLHTFQRRLLDLDLFALVEQDGGEDQNMRVPKGMMKMVSDLIVGEQETKESVIEMGWRREHSLEDTAEEIELSILGVLVEELLS